MNSLPSALSLSLSLSLSLCSVFLSPFRSFHLFPVLSFGGSSPPPPPPLFFFKLSSLAFLRSCKTRALVARLKNKILALVAGLHSGMIFFLRVRGSGMTEGGNNALDGSHFAGFLSFCLDLLSLVYGFSSLATL